MMMMNRISKRFAELKASGKKGFVGYLTAGDPDIVVSEANIRAALDNGLDVLELGIPFSDPTADGPTIQAAAQRALSSGMTLQKSLELVSRLREDYETPIILFGYANPFFHYGYKKLCKDAATAGVDGILVVDIPFGSDDGFRAEMQAHGLCSIPLIAPTTPEGRAKEILAEADGFVYYIMVCGVTGARVDVAVDVSEHINMLRRCTDLPIAVGFGVSDGEQAGRVAKDADAVVVGSALIRAACENKLDELVVEIKGAL
jgi:tryptophan synthase alpha chain